MHVQTISTNVRVLMFTTAVFRIVANSVYKNFRCSCTEVIRKLDTAGKEANVRDVISEKYIYINFEKEQLSFVGLFLLDSRISYKNK